MIGLFALSPTTDDAARAVTASTAQELAANNDPPVDVFARAVVLQLQFRRLGVNRKVSIDRIDVRSDDFTQDANEDKPGATDKRLLKATKMILDSPELQAIEKFDGETARYIDARKSGPAFANQGGFHLVALALKPAIDEWITERDTQRAALVDKFVYALPQRRADTVARLGVLGADVPNWTQEEARAAFGVTARYMTFGYTNEDEARAWQSEALSECRQALRVAFRDLVEHLAERLKPGETGKAKTFRDSLVTKFDDFARSFRDRNLADDGALAALVEQARQLMAGVSAADLRGKDGLRNAVAARMAEIKNAIDPLVVEAPTRRYQDED